MIREQFTKQNEEKLGSEVHIVSIEPDKQITTHKLNSNTKLQIVTDPNANLFCVSVDGSQHSEIAFDLMNEEFSSVSSKALVVHVYNEKNNENFNFRNRKETVIETYGNKISRIRSEIKFVIEDKQEDSSHALEQVHKIAQHFKANYLISGYYGIKGPKGDNCELSKGVHYLLGNSKINTVMVKDTTLRVKKKDKGYNWLVVMDKKFSRPVKCFHAFSSLINPQKDFVYGLTLKEFNQYEVDDVKEQFLQEIETKGIKNYNYEFMNYDRIASKIVVEKVNFGDVAFDFLVMYNNRDKYLREGSESDIVNIVKNCCCSICIYNF